MGLSDGCLVSVDSSVSSIIQLKNEMQLLHMEQQKYKVWER